MCLYKYSRLQPFMLMSDCRQHMSLPERDWVHLLIRPSLYRNLNSKVLRCQNMYWFGWPYTAWHIALLLLCYQKHNNKCFHALVVLLNKNRFPYVGWDNTVADSSEKGKVPLFFFILVRTFPGNPWKKAQVILWYIQ